MGQRSSRRKTTAEEKEIFSVGSEKIPKKSSRSLRWSRKKRRSERNDQRKFFTRSLAVESTATGSK